jgi:hypothetical protein
MIRAKVWLRCAAMHDPVLPVLVKPAVIGWQAKVRVVDLVIERGFTGAELLKRMKGWVTVSPTVVVEVLDKYGHLKCFDNGELVVEVEDETDLAALQQEVAERLGDQCNLEPIPRGM